MAARLTDKQKKKIIAEYVSGQSMRALARKYNIAPSTIKRVIDRDPKTKRKATDKKEQNTKEMLEYFTEQKGKAQQLLSSIIDALSDPEKLARANVRDLATAYGIIADKFLQTSPKENNELLSRAKEILGAFDGAIK